MRIAVFGMGHVGLVTAALLAEVGHQVAGIDVDLDKLALLRQEQMPFYEPGLEEIVQVQQEEGRLEFLSNGAEATGVEDIALICVGTPSDDLGLVDLSAVYDVLREIVEVYTRKDSAPVIVLRSTVPPAALDDMKLYLESLSRQHDWQLCANPEFLREGSAIADFRNPPLVVIGADDDQAGYTLLELYLPFMDPFFGWEDDLIVRTDCKTAMLLKYVSNAWHALKVTFANEIGDIATELEIDGRAVMEIMTRDKQLNISPAYLRPGNPFGGSCLPKDLRALLHMAWRNPSSILNAIVHSNDKRIWNIVDRAMATGAYSFGIIGMSFKGGTDDVRESPWMIIADRLLQSGGEVRMYDPDVREDAYDVLTDDLDTLLAWAECVIVGKSELLPQGTQLPPCVIYGDGRCS
ncbi:MAG: UDP-glucose/GDP-mannose dehydrogenase family protein [Anaerolineae bacterium]|nr:UDP-glucose/GDP-mannose dehydrogenase family protein [Anaerolineae bacterium]